MRVVGRGYGEVALYLGCVACLVLVTAQLAAYVTVQAMALAATHLPEQGPRPLSRVERQMAVIETAAIVEKKPDVAVLEMPATPVKLLAAQLDQAEQADRGAFQPAARPARHAARRVQSPTRLSAGEEFGRRFGVMIVASRSQ